MSYLQDIEDELLVEVWARSLKTVNNKYRDTSTRLNAMNSVNNCLRGRMWSEIKPKKRTKVAHRLLKIDREACAERLAQYMGWDDGE